MLPLLALLALSFFACLKVGCVQEGDSAVNGVFQNILKEMAADPDMQHLPLVQTLSNLAKELRVLDWSIVIDDIDECIRESRNDVHHKVEAFWQRAELEEWQVPRKVLKRTRHRMAFRLLASAWQFARNDDVDAVLDVAAFIVGLVHNHILQVGSESLNSLEGISHTSDMGSLQIPPEITSATWTFITALCMHLEAILGKRPRQRNGRF